jgi:hypothetical protein
MPVALNGTKPNGNRRMYFANSGALRFDVLKGEFQRDDQFIAYVVLRLSSPPHLL